MPSPLFNFPAMPDGGLSSNPTQPGEPNYGGIPGFFAGGPGYVPPSGSYTGNGGLGPYPQGPTGGSTFNTPAPTNNPGYLPIGGANGLPTANSNPLVSAAGGRGGTSLNQPVGTSNPLATPANGVTPAPVVPPAGNGLAGAPTPGPVASAPNGRGATSLSSPVGPPLSYPVGTALTTPASNTNPLQNSPTFGAPSAGITPGQTPFIPNGGIIPPQATTSAPNNTSNPLASTPSQQTYGGQGGFGIAVAPTGPNSTTSPGTNTQESNDPSVFTSPSYQENLNQNVYAAQANAGYTPAFTQDQYNTAWNQYMANGNFNPAAFNAALGITQPAADTTTTIPVTGPGNELSPGYSTTGTLPNSGAGNYSNSGASNYSTGGFNYAQPILNNILQQAGAQGGGYNSWGNVNQGNPYGTITGQANNGLSSNSLASVLNSLQANPNYAVSTATNNPLNGGLGNLTTLLQLYSALGAMPQPQSLGGTGAGQNDFYSTFY